MENKDKKTVSGGLDFCGALTIAFIVLKLLGKISWSWLWVLAPAWMPIGLALVIATIMVIFKK